MLINAPWVDSYLDAIEKKDERLFYDILDEMVKYPLLHDGLAQHSRTPGRILQKIVDQSKFEEIPLRLFENPNCPRRLLDKVIEENTPEFIEFVACNENLTREDLSKLVQRKELSSWLAGRKNLDPDHFIHLWENYLVDKSDVPYRLNLQLLVNLACNPSTPIKILKNIVKYRILDKDEHLVASYLLSNPALPDIDRAEYALLGITAETNLLENKDTDWYPTNYLFSIPNFPNGYLDEVSKLGHPGGILRSDVIPARLEDLDSHAIFNLWRQDQSIYKTLWPELCDFEGWKDGGVEFKHWLNYDGSFTYFLCDLELENEERQYDGEHNYHSIPGSPAWIPYQRDSAEAIENFGYIQFADAVEWGGTSEWLQAWVLSDADSESFTLTNFGEAFVIEQDLEYFDEQRIFDAEIVQSEIAAFGWKKLSPEKRDFLTQFIKQVYLEKEDNYYQYAEHFLICICLNPNTSDEVIDKHFRDLDSQLISEALKIRNS